MSIVKWAPEHQDLLLDRVQEEFSGGKPVVLPTDTLYGLAAPLSSTKTIREIFSIKKRPLEHTLPLALGDISMIDEVALISGWQKDLMRRGLPGPVTFIVEMKGRMTELVSREGTIAVRVPAHPIFHPLTLRSGPLALTSANLHGSTDLLTAEGIDMQFNGDLLVIEDDISITGTASAIVDLTHGAASVIREGNLNMKEFMGEAHGG
ncbi:MAG: threonylcarbamoyl-AMP synthase [Candidatus Thermoplasmatota archaeon]|nr:threonylcarbamoyl-AMP synthase [Candidatus Thermoplasmatota archaeon]